MRNRTVHTSDLKCHSPLRRCHATSRVLRLTGTELLIKQQQAARRYQKIQNKPERHDELMTTDQDSYPHLYGIKPR